VNIERYAGFFAQLSDSVEPDRHAGTEMPVQNVDMQNFHASGFEQMNLRFKVAKIQADH
jgi:hypothetical protein